MKKTQTHLLGGCLLLACACRIFGFLDLTKVPQPVMDNHPGWITLYNAAWKLAKAHVMYGNTTNGFVDVYMDEGFNNEIFQWDTDFMTMFANYSNGELPSIVSVENFYRKQWADGYINRVYVQTTGTNSTTPDDAKGINPPLFSWAEWRSFLLTADTTRFKKVIHSSIANDDKTILQRLVGYYNWIKGNKIRSNGLYWTTGYSSGWDNTPNQGYVWTDLSAQQAQNALYISKIAEVIGDTAVQHTFTKEYTDLKTLINTLLWDKVDGFYYNLNQNGTFLKCKTPMGFWPMLAQVATQGRADTLVKKHLLNTAEFWRLHKIPSLSADYPSYNSQGDYWLGSVWAPTNFMTICGLNLNNYEDIADSLAQNDIQCMYQCFLSGNTIYENYAPDFITRGSQSAVDFVGWSGVVPIAGLIETVIGIQPNVPANELYWNLRRTERNGITQYNLGRDTIKSIIAAQRANATDTAAVTVSTSGSFTLKAKVGSAIYTQQIASGQHTYYFPPRATAIRAVEQMPTVKSFALSIEGMDRIVFEGMGAPRRIMLYNLSGKVQQVLPVEGGRISVSKKRGMKIQPGIYLLQATDGATSACAKVVVK